MHDPSILLAEIADKEPSLLANVVLGFLLGGLFSATIRWKKWSFPFVLAAAWYLYAQEFWDLNDPCWRHARIGELGAAHWIGTNLATIPIVAMPISICLRWGLSIRPGIQAFYEPNMPHRSPAFPQEKRSLFWWIAVLFSIAFLLVPTALIALRQHYRELHRCVYNP